MPIIPARTEVSTGCEVEEVAAAARDADESDTLLLLDERTSREEVVILTMDGVLLEVLEIVTVTDKAGASVCFELVRASLLVRTSIELVDVIMCLEGVPVSKVVDCLQMQMESNRVAAFIAKVIILTEASTSVLKTVVSVSDSRSLGIFSQAKVQWALND